VLQNNWCVQFEYANVLLTRPPLNGIAGLVNINETRGVSMKARIVAFFISALGKILSNIKFNEFN
jgi:hypothetical protein